MSQPHNHYNHAPSQVREAQRAGDSNIWLLTPDELLALHGDFPLESITGTKCIQNELLDSYGNLGPCATDTRNGLTTWGIRSDHEPVITRKLEQ